MKKLSGIIILVILCFFGVVVTACNDNTIPAPEPEVKKFSVIYKASAGGFIVGDDKQTIQEGKDTEGVEARALDGYKFIKWNDNESTEPIRVDKNINSGIIATAIFERIYFSTNYEANAGGSIDGIEEQSIAYGENAKKIEAVPNKDYLFAGWSDGKFTNPRLDKNVQENIAVTASFVKKTKTFDYFYNNATSNNTTASITLSYDEINKASFVVPQRDNYTFGGWYLEPEFTTKVTDGNGKLFYGNGVFYAESDNLYAKWISDDYVSKDIIYPILMIFVEEIHANLETVNGTKVEVNYKMPIIERKVYELIPQQFSKYLNGIFDGRVIFEIDTYFTTEPLDESNISAGYRMISNGWFKDHKITAYDVPEVGSLLDKYRSVMTTYNMNDNQEALIHSYGGSATMKYASMPADMIFWALENNNVPLEDWLDITSTNWQGEMEHYSHEFTHTVEHCYSQEEIYDYHSTSSGLKNTTQYLLGEYIVNGEKVGIPFSYWTGEIEVLAEYQALGNCGGTIISSNDEHNIYYGQLIKQTVSFGNNGATITAIPDEGYRFVKWSDGITTATRHDKNIISYLRVTAIFEKIDDT